MIYGKWISDFARDELESDKLNYTFLFVIDGFGLDVGLINLILSFSSTKGRINVFVLSFSGIALI